MSPLHEADGCLHQRGSATWCPCPISYLVGTIYKKQIQHLYWTFHSNLNSGINTGKSLNTFQCITCFMFYKWQYNIIIIIICTSQRRIDSIRKIWRKSTEFSGNASDRIGHLLASIWASPLQNTPPNGMVNESFDVHIGKEHTIVIPSNSSVLRAAATYLHIQGTESDWRMKCTSFILL